MNKFLWTTISIVIGLAIFYLIGCFIALSFNPLTWWIFTSTAGRIIFAIYFILCLVGSVKANEDD